MDNLWRMHVLTGKTDWNTATRIEQDGAQVVT